MASIVDRAARRALLSQRVRKMWAAGGGPIRRIDRGEPGLLSPVEEEFWLLEELDPGDPRLVPVLAFRLRGRLDLACLERALDQLVERHEGLRTRYPLIGDEPRRIVEPPVPVPIPLERVSLEAVEPSAREDEARRRGLAEATRRFDLPRGPLFRANLAELAADDHALILSMHHIVADGTALSIVKEDLFALYVSARDGRPASLPDLPIQYADYAAWEREAEPSSERAEKVAYWKAHLAGTCTLNLPNRQRQSRPGARGGADQKFVLPASLANRIRARSLEFQAAPSTMVMAAFVLLLAKYSGQTDFAFGAVVANRQRPEARRLVACFINTLALRARLNEALTVRELIDDMQAELLLAYTYPNVRLHEVARSRRKSGVDVGALFIAHPPAREISVGGELRVDPFDLRKGHRPRFDLTLWHCDQADRSMALRLFYAPEFFDASTIELMTRDLRSLLEGMVERPADRAFELPLASGDPLAEPVDVLKDVS